MKVIINDSYSKECLVVKALLATFSTLHVSTNGETRSSQVTFIYSAYRYRLFQSSFSMITEKIMQQRLFQD